MRARGVDRPVRPVRAGIARIPPLAVLFWVAVAVTGVGASSTGATLPARSAVLVGREAPLDEAAANPGLLASNNSPTLARNPVDHKNLVVVNRVDLPMFSCAMYLSFDSGVTWERATLPFPAGEELPERCFAPDAAFDADGRLYVSFVTLEGRGNTPHAAWLVASADGGRTFSTPVPVLGPLAFQVRLATDPGRPGRVWLSWLAVDEVAFFGFGKAGNPVKAARSDDGGSTWTDPVVVSDPGHPRAVAPSVAVGHDGRPYVLYLDLGDDRLDYHGAHRGRGGDPYDGRWVLVLARSADGGATWGRSVVAGDLVPTERIVVQFPPSPSLAVDSRRRRVVVAYADGRLGDADVWAWVSSDGGATFDRGRRVNDNRRGDGTSQYLPRLGVAPDGRIDAVYLDRRADRANVRSEVSLQASTDGGRSWAPRVRLTTGSFDSGIGFGVERGLPDLGSRLAVLSTGRRAMAVWPDTRAGTRASGKQDLVRAVVAVEDGSPWRRPLTVGGLLLAGAGAVGLAATLLARSGVRPPALLGRPRRVAGG